MERFVLKIPGRGTTTHHGDPFGVLRSINHVLRRLPGITDEDWNGWDFELIGTYHDRLSGVRFLDIHQNHGIPRQGIEKALKESFKVAMPEIKKKLPGMSFPFKGRMEFHSYEDHLKEVHFIPT